MHNMTSYKAEEYYNYKPVKENLYNKALKGEQFKEILSEILVENNLRMAYRKLKTNKGSKTKGTDTYTIENVKCTTLEEYLIWMTYWILDYNPKAVRRKYIPKPNGEKRPLGIPCIRDRLIQESILQILEPILEAKMDKHSFGFRKGKCVQDAIEHCRNLVRHGNYFVVDFDIKKCFDSIPHKQLINTLWKNGVQDKQLLMIIKKMLKAPALENGKLISVTKGTPQGGIISPLLTNIVLNELDKWVSSQYETNPSLGKKERNWFRRYKKTKLKKGILIRYADDIVIFTNSLESAKAWYYRTQKWLKKKLKLEINPEKSRIIDLRKDSLTFLGYKIKGNKLGVMVHEKSAKGLNGKQFRYTSSGLSEKLIEKIVRTLRILLRLLLKETNSIRQIQLICRINSTIIGIHNFAQYATNCASILWKIYRRIRLLWYKTKYLRRDTTTHYTETFMRLYPECKGLPPIFSLQNITIFPIWKVLYKQHPFRYNSYLKSNKHQVDNAVTIEITNLLKSPILKGSIEYNDLRISKYSAQKGCDYITGTFLPAYNVHCHHIIPRKFGGLDKFNNLIIVSEHTHKLIHNSKPQIPYYFTKKMITKLNKLRTNVGNSTILLNR